MQNFLEGNCKTCHLSQYNVQTFFVWFRFQNIEHNLQIFSEGLLVRSTNHQYPNSLLFLIILFHDFQMLMHRIKKLSGLPFMLPHFRNMERYLKCFFGFCSDCFIHHNNGEVKQGVHPSSWPWQLEKHPPQTTKAGQRRADSDGRRAASLQKGFHHQTWNHTQMRPLRQRLSLLDWPV